LHARGHTITSLTLELNEPEGAFRRLEEWLRGHGFFAPGGEDLVAQLYLGYGLSRVIRRHDAPPPPEPCPLPLLACVVRRDNYIVSIDNDREERKVMDGDEAFETGPWSRTWPESAYGAAITAVREAIGRGDVYQVNLVQHFEASFRGSPRALAASLEGLTQPREWPLAEPDWRVLEIGAADDARDMGQTEGQGGGWAIVSASPELFLARRGRRVWTMPIKGTRPSGWGAELHASPKDAAEHVMIVDLERNDLSRVCEPGSVRWPELMTTASLAGVEHMVSLVEGRLRENVGLAELLEATFPGGSITGAPKIAAVDLIAELEPVGRGASMGALGRVHGNGDLELALTIRTFAIRDGRIHLWAGGGIVWDSDPAAEIAESVTKAAPLLAAIGAPLDRISDAGMGCAATATHYAAGVDEGSRSTIGGNARRGADEGGLPT
jgi:para-aminobenzoate synthetase component 1